MTTCFLKFQPQRQKVQLYINYLFCYCEDVKYILKTTRKRGLLGGVEREREGGSE